MSVFIEAIPNIISKHSKVSFIVAGDGPEKNSSPNPLAFSEPQAAYGSETDFDVVIHDHWRVIGEPGAVINPAIPDGLAYTRRQ